MSYRKAVPDLQPAHHFLPFILTHRDCAFRRSELDAGIVVVHLHKDREWPTHCQPLPLGYSRPQTTSSSTLLHVEPSSRSGLAFPTALNVPKEPTFAFSQTTSAS